VTKASPGIRFNEHIEGDGPTVFAHACKMGLEGIVSKRKDSAYRSGRSPDWLKFRNPDAPAVAYSAFSPAAFALAVSAQCADRSAAAPSRQAALARHAGLAFQIGLSDFRRA